MSALAGITVTGFVTRNDVELAAVGDWNTVSGDGNITLDDLQAAVAAYNDPGGMAPRIKLGHGASGIGAMPAYGRVEQLRMSEDGMSLVGDLVGVPAWLDAIMPTAFPSRSIEARRNVVSGASGRPYQFVIDALALLGVEPPAVESLEDLQAAFSPEGPAFAGGERFIAERGDAVPAVEAPVHAAGATDNDVWPAFNEWAPWSWWIRELFLDPMMLIVTDDSAGPGDPKLYRVPFSINGTAIEFGDASPVEVEYVDAKVAAARGAAESRSEPTRVFASRSESRPATPNTEEHEMDPKAIREQLNLSADATDEQVTEALTRAGELLAAVPSTTDTTTSEGGEGDNEQTDPTGLPDGFTALPASELQQLQADAAAGREARQEQIAASRTAELDRWHRQEGRISAAERPHFARLLEKDPDACRALVATRAKGTVPVDAARGTGVDADEHSQNLAAALAIHGIDAKGA